MTEIEIQGRLPPPFPPTGLRRRRTHLWRNPVPLPLLYDPMGVLSVHP